MVLSKINDEISYQELKTIDGSTGRIILGEVKTVKPEL